MPLPAIAIALAWGLRLMIGYIMARIAITFGFAIIAYTGLDIIYDQIAQAITGTSSLLPADMAAVIGLTGIGSAINIILSALAARMAMDGIKDGILRLGGF